MNIKNRRKFIKNSLFGGISLGGMVLAPTGALIAAAPSESNRQSDKYAPDRQFYLSRYVPNLGYSDTADLVSNTATARYKPIFGEGDKDGAHLNGITRIGELTLDPGGRSTVIKRPDEEYVLYVTEGKGSLLYDEKKIPLKTNDFMYVPAGVGHGITNLSDKPIKVFLMGYRLGDKKDYSPKEELQIANSDDVELQVLGSHGPSTQYKLLMGDTTSDRDRLAAASLVKSLFIMDFAPRGTNNPHHHKTQEEVYFVLKGSGYMIAGLDKHGNDDRHPCQEGDAFYWAAGTELGFYSLNKEGEEHSIILAIRSDDPSKPQSKKE
ncbi:Cupin domain-containing protein [Pricia antarctica]|uniref:Cupin domain-containing protein n=1 Tax=Pricia antarctica TaxID=641691 RepID=A0A1G7J1V8_9FLAO|nr:cupin domain-containing protein [Pricia antarctica]SDF18967.1 Cupin domain-containing protein [Pricia antarctica]